MAVSVALAVFLALALNPVVGWLQRHRLSKAMAITVVFAGFVLVFAGVIWVVVPMVVTQIGAFAAAVPQYLTDMRNRGPLKVWLTSGVYAASVAVGFMMSSNSTGVSFPSLR